MSSEIDNNYVQINTLFAPICINAATNVSPSMPPNEGSIARDENDAGVLYVGTGLSWRKAAAGGDVVGPQLSTNNDLVAFDGLTGKLVKSSTIQSGDVVKASTTSVDNNLVAYNGTGGRTVKDSLVSIINDVVLNVTFTDTSGGNPDFVATLSFMRIASGTGSTSTSRKFLRFGLPLAGIVFNGVTANWSTGLVIPQSYIRSSSNPSVTQVVLQDGLGGYVTGFLEVSSLCTLRYSGPAGTIGGTQIHAVYT